MSETVVNRKDMLVDAPSTPSRRNWAAAIKVLLVVLLVLTGSRLRLDYNVSVGNALTFLLLPCWILVWRRYHAAVLFVVLALFSLASGIWLTTVAAVDHTIDWTSFAFNSGLLVSLLAGVGLILWAREYMPDAHVAQWFGVGLVLGVVPAVSGALGENLWKYGFSFGVAVVVLALAQRSGSRWMEFLALGGLAAVSAVTDSRSQFAILLFTAALVAWQMRPLGRSVRTTAVKVLLVAAVGAAIMFNIVQALLLGGFLGEAAQVRSEAQIATSGSLLVGGRPEMAASAAMFLDRPMGYGPGTIPSAHDIHVAKSGMEAIHYAPDNGYVGRYMFGQRIELHSVVADFWARFGILGIVLSAFILVLAVVMLAKLLARSQASALMIYVLGLTIWNLPFSPVYSSLPALMLAVGLSLAPRTPRASSIPALVVR